MENLCPPSPCWTVQEPEPEHYWDLVRHKHAVKDHEERELVRKILLDLYHRMRPEKVGDVDGLMKEWEGEERLLLAKVRAKYGESSKDLGAKVA